MPGKPVVESKGAQILIRGQTPEELEQIRGFKTVCRKDNIVMRKELLGFVRQFNKAHHWPPGNPQHNIDEPAWSEEEQLGEEAAVEEDADVRAPDVPIDSKQQRKVDVTEGHWEICEECKGEGTVPPFGFTCTHCNGFKRLWIVVALKRPDAVLRSQRHERAVR
jgi:hypothetical protein